LVDLAETLSPEAPQRAQWLEVAQFQTEDRAQKFRGDFMWLAGSEELDHVTGPALAGFIADDLKMNSQWRIMDQPELEKLRAGEWGIVHNAGEWQPQMDGPSPTQPANAITIDLDL
jgi:hypothetical protein